MTKVLTMFMLMVTCFESTYANEFLVQSFEKVENGLSALRFERVDVNDIPCAIIKVRTDIPKPFVFDANLGIEGNIEYNENNEIWIYVSEGERQLTVAKEGFVTLKYTIPQKIETSSVYSLVLKARDNKISVVIISNPTDAEKWIDGELVGTQESFDIEMGEHRLEVKKEGYKNYLHTITIDDKNSLFRNINLVEIDLVPVQIRSKPQGAIVYIDDVDRGKTPLPLWLYPGKYNMKLALSGHAEMVKVINIDEGGNNEIFSDLEKISGSLILRITPKNTKVLLNKQKYDSQQIIELAPGTYRIEIEKDGWYAESDNLTVEQGTIMEKKYSLKQKTGNLRFSALPLEAIVNMNDDDERLYQSWSGMKYLKQIPVGIYTLECEAEGFESVNKRITIEENSTQTIDISLVVSESNTQDWERVQAQESTTEIANSSSGFKMGIMSGIPIYLSAGLADLEAAPVYGICLETPFYLIQLPTLGFSINASLGAEIGYFDFNSEYSNANYSGFIMLGILNSVLFELDNRPVFLEAGVGYFGASAGSILGVAYNVEHQNLPLMIKPYIRTNLVLVSGEESTTSELNSVAWLNVGLNLSYIFSK